MAYNSKNLLRKIIEIQNIYMEHKAKGVTGKFIFENLIKPNYHIGMTTFKNYLGRNAKRELKVILIAEEEKRQNEHL